MACVLLLAAAIILAGMDNVSRADRIGNDRGGLVIQYALKVARAKKRGKRVELRGRCASACTLHLSLPQEQLCIGKNAFFVFHAPYGSTTKGNARAKAFLLSRYPEWVRSWIRRKGGLTGNALIIPRAYAAKFIKAC